MGFRGWPTQPSRLVMVVAPRCSSSEKEEGKKNQKEINSEDFMMGSPPREVSKTRGFFLPHGLGTQVPPGAMGNFQQPRAAQSSHHKGTQTIGRAGTQYKKVPQKAGGDAVAQPQSPGAHRNVHKAVVA